MAAIGRRNVQEQNRDTQQRIRAIASAFEADPLRFSWLIEVLQSKAVSPRNGILMSLSQTPDQEGELHRGLWLTKQRQFFEFAVMLSRIDSEPKLEEWKDVSSQMTVNAHQPGTGKSLALLALEVLDGSHRS